MKRFAQKYYSLLVIAFVFFVYLSTLAPSVVEIDSGELATVQILAGIAHPTGYPLFTLVGYAFSKLPIFTSKIYLMNLLAALWCVLALRMFIKVLEIIFTVLNNKVKTAGTNRKKKTPRNNFHITKPEFILTALLSALFLAFSKTFWSQSTSVEVYSLQLFLFMTIIYFILKAFNFNDNFKWLKVAVVLAFGFSNHMTTLLLLPGLAYLFFIREGFNSNAVKTIIKMLLIFLLILAVVYSYLPLRASYNPVLNWGNPVDWENFWRHFTGRQYQVWMFTSFNNAKNQFVKYLFNLPSEFGYGGIPLVFIGFYELKKYSKSLFYYLLINLFFTVIYVINYNIHDLDSYFLLSYISMALVLPFAFMYLKRKISDYKITTVVFLIILGMEIIPNFKAVNRRGDFAFEDYTKSILNNADKNSIILSYQWDYFVSSSYYFRYVENYRRDVAVVDKELLRRSWYYNQLNRNYPFLLKGIKPLVNNFKRALRPFERGEKYNSLLLEKYYRSIITGIIAENIKTHSIYLAPEMVDNELRRKEFALPEGYALAPYYYYYKIVKAGRYVKMPLNIKIFRFPAGGNHYTKFIRRIAAEMLLKRAIYELQFNKKENARYFIRKAEDFSNEFILPVSLRRLLNQ